MAVKIPVDRSRAYRMAGALVGLAVALGGCTYTEAVVATASVPDDYRQRHPIAIQEADRSVVLFVGHARGGLSASQRADVMGLAQIWLQEGTGAIQADVPVGTPNARTAADSLREIQSLLAAAGVPPRGLAVRRYHPEDPPDVTTSAADDHIAPAPRVSIQAFCETVETAAAVQAAGEDRRLGKAHIKIQMGGMAAATEAYRTAPTPNVIILETEGRNDILTGLDQLATVCDSGTRVVVIGRINDVTLYRELVRRGVSDYLLSPVTTPDVVRSDCY